MVNVSILQHMLIRTEKLLMMLSLSEENYLKVIYLLTIQAEEGKTSTSLIAERTALRPASVTDMLRKLKEKGLIDYEKYGKVCLSAEGQQVALQVVRRHRLWEYFLCEKLGFSWDQVHQVAEQLEHVQSAELVERLDRFLGYPRLDPHGEPIPDSQGRMLVSDRVSLAAAPVGANYQIAGVDDSSEDFLRYLTHLGLSLGTRIRVVERLPFENSVVVATDDGRTHTLTGRSAGQIWMEEVKG